MISIRYCDEKELVFDIDFKLVDYITDDIFEKYQDYSELAFMHKLLIADSNIRFINRKPMIWSTHHIYSLNNKEFTVVLDEDYGLLSYAVRNPEDRKFVAEYIGALINKMKL